MYKESGRSICIITIEEKWLLFKEKTRIDRKAYARLSREKIKWSIRWVLETFVQAFLDKKISIDLSLGTPSSITKQDLIYLNPATFKELKLFLVEYSELNKMCYPRGVSGIISRLVDLYMQMDYREIARLLIEYDKKRVGVVDDRTRDPAEGHQISDGK